ncbi:conserved hypothetical protein [Altererythrobacter sp. B11]|uniref:hypothetical protein n=1 Tax=Altererythrobacter sp. B11 TaxID=2060312 RepID=UPI000DC7055E|nr:hypothetical protein [Altererythrobacter sp. B11]BBC72803.1 conserved hypothetical protein [Altererythrobacter sp. B11]
MRRAVLVGAMLLLAACQREPDFDERYAKAQADLREKAARIDAELAKGAPPPSSAPQVKVGEQAKP